MEEYENTQSTSSSPSSVGEDLRAAREAKGLSRADIATRTRVAERHLIAIEENRFSELAAPTYAVGFSRTYARAVGMNEKEVAARVRRQLDAQAPSRPAPAPSFEPGDPARVPPSRIAWLAGVLAVVLVGAAFIYWSDLLAPRGTLPDLLPEEGATAAPPVAAGTRAPAPAATPAVTSGPVVLTALAPKVWVKVTDGGGKQLLQRELAQGESYAVPADAQGAQLRTGRPDALRITVGDRALPLLGVKPQVVSGVVLTAEALVARTKGSGNPVPPPPSGPASQTAGAAATPGQSGAPAVEMPDILAERR